MPCCGFPDDDDPPAMPPDSFYKVPIEEWDRMKQNSDALAEIAKVVDLAWSDYNRHTIDHQRYLEIVEEAVEKYTAHL